MTSFSYMSNSFRLYSRTHAQADYQSSPLHAPCSVLWFSLLQIFYTSVPKSIILSPTRTILVKVSLPIHPRNSSIRWNKRCQTEVRPRPQTLLLSSSPLLLPPPPPPPPHPPAILSLRLRSQPPPQTRLPLPPQTSLMRPPPSLSPSPNSPPLPHHHLPSPPLPSPSQPDSSTPPEKAKHPSSNKP